MLVPLPKYPYFFLLHLLNSSSLLDIHHWWMSFSHADIFNIPHQQLCGLNPLFNTTFSGITWHSFCLLSLITAIYFLFLPSTSRQEYSGYLLLDGSALVTLAGVCNENIRSSSFLHLERFQSQRDCTNGDLQAEGFGACLLLFAFLTCLFCCFVFKETFSPERVEFNSGK